MADFVDAGGVDAGGRPLIDELDDDFVNAG
jgi:hypothetical protein